MLSTPDQIAAFNAAAGELRAVEWLDERGRGCRREGASMARLIKRRHAGGFISIRIDVADAEPFLAPPANPGEARAAS